MFAYPPPACLLACLPACAPTFSSSRAGDADGSISKVQQRGGVAWRGAAQRLTVTCTYIVVAHSLSRRNHHLQRLVLFYFPRCPLHSFSISFYRVLLLLCSARVSCFLQLSFLLRYSPHPCQSQLRRLWLLQPSKTTINRPFSQVRMLCCVEVAGRGNK